MRMAIAPRSKNMSIGQISKRAWLIFMGGAITLLLLKSRNWRKRRIQLKRIFPDVHLFLPVSRKNKLVGKKFRSDLNPMSCLLYTSDAADEEDSVDLGGRR